MGYDYDYGNAGSWDVGIGMACPDTPTHPKGEVGSFGLGLGHLPLRTGTRKCPLEHLHNKMNLFFQTFGIRALRA